MSEPNGGTPEISVVPKAVEARIPSPSTKRGRGRPSTGFDKKAYDRERMKRKRSPK